MYVCSISPLPKTKPKFPFRYIVKNDKYIPASILHGKVGEDAYFRAHYAGELCEDKSGTRKDMIIFSAHNFKKKLNFLQTTFKSAQTTKFYKIST